MSQTTLKKEKNAGPRGDFVVSKNPATGEAIGTSPLNSPEDVYAAVKKAKEVQPLWAATPVKERAKKMLKVRDYVVEHADELAEIISRDNGKTKTEALVAEIFGTAMNVDFFAKKAARFLKDKPLPPANLLLAYKRSKIIRVPFGVVGIISPWNYPFTIPFVEIIMALMAGNAVVLKVATETQMVGHAIERCVAAAGLPDGLFAHLNLPGRKAGDAFFAAGIDKLFFTGSTAVGKELMAKAAQTLTPVSLELGGNDPMLVCPDANLFRAASGAVWAGLTNTGQTCAAVERIYVHKDVYDPFLAILVDQVKKLRVGVGADYDADIGAMTTTQQVETVKRHLDDALKKGAKVAAESECPKKSNGNFLPAMVLTDVNHSMLLMREETFGPVLGVMKVNDMEEAVRLANDSNLGLTASVWSKNRKYAESLARRIQAGVVMINDHLLSNGLAETPWGGFKESGIGRTHGEMGFNEMTEPLCIVHDYLPGVQRNMWWYPQSKQVYDGIKGTIDFLYSPNLIRKLLGSLKTTRLFMRTFTKKN